MDDKYLQQIQNYYLDWDGQDSLDLNHRSIKILARNRESDKLCWFNFHQLVNKRRISNDQFPNLLNEVIKQDIIPLRIFQSCTEWLAPNEIWKSNSPRILRSGFMPLENDTNLDSSLETANLLSSIVSNPRFVYSGNKSIHTWVPIKVDKLSDKEIAYADQREKAERKYRYKLFNSIQSQIPHKLDTRISADTRRVVPMINTINGLTGRKVIELDTKQITNLNTTQIRQIASVYDWKGMDLND